MPADSRPAPTAGDFLSGIPVPVDPVEIDRELAKLWKPEGGGAEEAVTRAALSNLLVFVPEARERPRMMEVLRGVGRRFPSRIIAVMPRDPPEDGKSRLSAWVNAICHLPAPGSPPVCCEEIRLEADGADLDLLPGAVLPLLIPDLPVIVAAPSPAGEAFARVFAEVADRVVFDARRSGVAGLEAADRFLRAHSRLEGDGLAWRDTAPWRRTICDLFDEPRARKLLDAAARVEVACEGFAGASGGPGPPAAAALVAGWLASRLRRKLEVTWRAAPRARAALPDGRPDSGRLVSVLLAAGRGEGADFVKVAREEESGHFRIDHHTEAACVLPRLVPARDEGEAELLGAAVERTTHQKVFREALAAAAKLAAG